MGEFRLGECTGQEGYFTPAWSKRAGWDIDWQVLTRHGLGTSTLTCFGRIYDFQDNSLFLQTPPPAPPESEWLTF